MRTLFKSTSTSNPYASAPIQSAMSRLARTAGQAQRSPLALHPPPPGPVFFEICLQALRHHINSCLIISLRGFYPDSDRLCSPSTTCPLRGRVIIDIFGPVACYHQVDDCSKLCANFWSQSGISLCLSASLHCGEGVIRCWWLVQGEIIIWCEARLLGRYPLKVWKGYDRVVARNRGFKYRSQEDSLPRDIYEAHGLS